MRHILTFLLLAIGLQAAPINPATVDSWTPSLMRGILGYWKLDTPSDGSWVDSFGTNHLTSFNSPTSTNGLLNEAYYGDKTKYLEGFRYTTLSNGFTLNCWVKLDAASGNNTIGGQWHSGNNTASNTFLFVIEYPNIKLFSDNNNSADISVAGGTYLTNWTMLTATMTAGTSAAIYTNGVIASNRVFNPATTTGAAPFRLFRIGAGSSYELVGAADEAGLWNRPITSSEVLQLFNATKARRFPFNSGP